MRKLAVALVILLVASASYGAKNKAKVKEKRFEPVVKSAADYAGSYRGPDASYGLILESSNGKLHGNYVEMGRVAVLSPIEVDGAEFKAMASFDDGSSRTITGSFANRILNGKTAFGARLYDVPVEGLGIVDPFFEKLE
ncbi:MAG TPA: hypothetical protein VHL59_06960 [Thermoanaerobaculia bacterium]|nr:hypothetical protein [Thermoanaerobaculia bacterium]